MSYNDLKVCTTTELLISAVETRATNIIVLKYLAEIISNQTGQPLDEVHAKMLAEKENLQANIVDNMVKYI